MDADIPPQIRDKWVETVKGIGDYRGTTLLRAWELQTCKTMVAVFPPHFMNNMPAEFMDVHLNVDYHSLEHLWVKTFHLNLRKMNLGQIRYLIDVFLTNHTQIRLNPAQYSDWIGELLLILNADEETGTVTKDNFLKLFPLWLSSRILNMVERRGAVHEIIFSWTYLDVSDCGVLSEESITNLLLPYAFRRLYPRSGPDDSDLKEAWIKLMKPEGAMRKSEWINEWSEFQSLNPLAFVDELDNTANIMGLGRQAMMYLGVSEGSIPNLERLLSLANPNKQARSRAFSLWLVTLDHGRLRFAPMSVAENTCKAIPVLSLAEARDMCQIWWTHYLGPVEGNLHTKMFTDWSNRLLDSLSIQSGPILRDELVGRFLTDLEVEALWTQFAVTQTHRISPEEMRALFVQIYLENNVGGDWVIEQWMHAFAKMCYELGLFDDPKLALVTKRVFTSAFPLFFASNCLSTVTEQLENEAVSAVWPIEDAQQVMYSEYNLRNLLREIWKKIVPEELKMPCQDWWLDRCVLRLGKVGTGITRSLFSSLFISREEVEALLCAIPELNQASLAKLLTNATEDIGPAKMEEFYLLTDLKHRSIGVEQLSEISREAFRIAFPLWLAANGYLITNSN